MHHDSESAALVLSAWGMSAKREKQLAQIRRSNLYVAARILVGLLFLASAVGKIVHLEATEHAMQDLGLFDAGLLLPIGIVVEMVGGLSLAIGFRVRALSIGLMFYLVTAMLLVNNDLSDSLNVQTVMTGIAFLSALMMLTAHGSGTYSVDRWIEHRRSTRFGLRSP